MFTKWQCRPRSDDGVLDSSGNCCRSTQLGVGWYAACDVEVAWFFVPLVPGNVGRGSTVIEMDIPALVLERLVTRGRARRGPLANVLFAAPQYGFAIGAFTCLNACVIFRPYAGQEQSHGSANVHRGRCVGEYHGSRQAGRGDSGAYPSSPLCSPPHAGRATFVCRCGGRSVAHGKISSSRC